MASWRCVILAPCLGSRSDLLDSACNHRRSGDARRGRGGHLQLEDGLSVVEDFLYLLTLVFKRQTALRSLRAWDMLRRSR